MFSTQDVTKEEILSKIPQEEIFKKYLKIDVNYGLGFKNPLRKDNHGDCHFYIDERDMLKFHDIPMGWNWDCFNLVQKVHNCNYYESLKIIAQDFNLRNISANVEHLKSKKADFLNNKSYKKLIKIETRNWFSRDLEYWGQFNITEKILSYYDVFPIRKAFLDDMLIYKYRSLDDLGYAFYLGNGNFKLYFPFRKKGESQYPKFYHNCPLALQGFKQLPPSGETLIITKALKDVASMFSYRIDAVANISETVIVGENYMVNLKLRFKNIYTLFDRDRTGIRMSIKMRNKFNTTPLLIPSNSLFATKEKKDFTDMVKVIGRKQMFNEIKNYRNGQS